MNNLEHIDQEILDSLKKFNWNEIITKGNQLEDLNDRQWRFMKGLVIELIVEKYSEEENLKYVGMDHKDYDWSKFNLSVELKSGLSDSMYCKKGGLKKSFTIKFNNSNGTNKKSRLNPDQVADLLLVIKNDGAFVVNKYTVLKNSIQRGDGFDLVLSKNDITEITSKIKIDKDKNLNIKEKIQNAIKQVI